MVAIQAVDCGVVGIDNNHRHRGAGQDCRVDIAAGIVAGAATAEMGGQDLSKGRDRMAVGAGLGVSLTAVGQWVDLHGVINAATGSAMVMTSEIGGVAGNTLAAANNRRGNQGAVACRVVACGATLGSMSLTDADEWRGGSAMATDTVAGGWNGH